MMYFERVPKASAGWTSVPAPTNMPGEALRLSVWQKGQLRVISAVELAEYPDGQGHGPQWHISISVRGLKVRPTDRQTRAVLREFAMPRVEEDNHHPGNARHYWCPIDPAHRVDCECKVDEAIVREPDGYTWSNDKDPGACRGCEFAAVLGKPCPVHSLHPIGDVSP
jgi:hypothetical protein